MTGLVRITDVAPRDGLQNEAALVPTAEKARLVEALCATGVDEIEVTSFVSPKWIPQLGDAAELLELITGFKAKAASPLCFSALVPNAKGMDRLIEANDRAGFALIDKVSVFTAASETFSQKNTNASIAQTLERFVPVIEAAKSHGLAVRGYVSCVIACPFEGAIEPAAVARLSQQLIELGVGEIDLGDTIGVATPDTTRAVLEAVLQAVDASRLVLHLHDTHGRAASCARTALDMGLRSFDSSAGGLGGCPYASTPGKRAPGNISTSALLDAIEAAGMTTHVDRDKLSEVSRLATEIVSAAGKREAAP